MSIKKTISLTIKPTNLCNFRCKHCFNGENLLDENLLPIETALKTLELISKQYDDIKVTFHGGEPTLVGKDYYYKIFKHNKILKEKYNVSFSYIFQTNGFLLNEDFINLLISENVLISISFDGPHNDILRSNTSSIYDTIKFIQKKKGRLRVFCVESSKSIDNLIETYEWFKSNNINYKILPIQPRGFAENEKDLILDINHYTEILMQLYKKWLTDKNNNIILYTFEEFLRLQENVTFKDLWFDRKLSLNSDGKLYPFGRPYDTNFCLGDPLVINNIDNCFQSKEYINLKNILNQKIKEKCNTCNAYNVCGGTCLCSSYVYGNDDRMLDYACSFAEKIFTSVININKEIQLNISNKEANFYNSKVIAYYLNNIVSPNCKTN